MSEFLPPISSETFLRWRPAASPPFRPTVVEPVNWADATDEVAIEIMEWLRERISKIKMPRSLDFHPKLPRMDNGKLYKRRLAEEYRGGARGDDTTAATEREDG